jgi:hypothetical protein
MRPDSPHSCSGLALLELLVATAIALLLSGALLTMAAPSNGGFRTQPASVDVVQRLRAAVEALSSDLQAAGSGPVNPLSGVPLGSVVPCVLPYRVGQRRPDPAGTFRGDVVTAMSAAPGMAAARLPSGFVGRDGVAPVEPLPGCPAGNPACGIEAGMSVVLLDALGQWDLYGVAAVDGPRIRLEPRGPSSARPYPPGSWIVPIAISTHYLRPAAGSDGPQLMRYDGHQSDLPEVDHVVSLAFEYFGEPLPPQRRVPPGPLGQAMTYGPAPPAPGEDDGRDAWGPGENCVTAVDGGGMQAARLGVLGASHRLQPLAPAAFADGPWCPDASAATRFDADLLRIRRVRIRLRVEAWSDTLRGADARLFLRPGTAAGTSWVVRDRETVLDVVPRTLGGGR